MRITSLTSSLRLPIAWIGLTLPSLAQTQLPLSVHEMPPPAALVAPTGTNAPLPFVPAAVIAVGDPETGNAYLSSATSSWFGAQRLEWEIVPPSPFPTNTQVLAFMKDWDYLWYQRLLPGFLVPGATNRFRLDVSPQAGGWVPQGHQGAWNARSLMRPTEFGIRLFGDAPGAFTCRVQNVRLVYPATDTNAPWIADVRATTNRVPCYERFELRFNAPDRYANPFDPDAVAVVADIEMPDGRRASVDGFYTRDFYRTRDAAGELTLPQGAPHWRVRFAPTLPGRHRYRLRIRDAFGEATWGPGTFDAIPAALPGYVRVSRRDSRHFEFDNQTFFFPIGHNIRSPSDSRLNSAFPWMRRWTEGTLAYARYFRDMARSGENFAEVWMAPWSLGLEWSPKWRGYHGVGQYNLMHAWEFDRTLEEAERNGIYLNVVIHNHGKYSAFSDNEWVDNPMNVAAEGYLQSPDEFFSDPRALRDFRNLMRYTVARWGYSTRIFAWQLWSELNLAGSKHGTYRRQEVVDWHSLMARAIKDLDPNDHLVSTHVSGDYTAQYTNIVALPELDHVCVDAYYGGAEPLQIVRLMRATADFNNPFGKPVLVSEFGGAWDAQDLMHLENCLHAGLWSSVGIPVAGTPMFWWWGLIEEENLYPEYAALARFMTGEDRRDTNLVAAPPSLWFTGGAGATFTAQCVRDQQRALGWICNDAVFGNEELLAAPAVSNLLMRINGVTNASSLVEFWETTHGTVAYRTNAPSRDGGVTVQVPPFARDWAFKVRPAP